MASAYLGIHTTYQGPGRYRSLDASLPLTSRPSVTSPGPDLDAMHIWSG